MIEKVSAQLIRIMVIVILSYLLLLSVFSTSPLVTQSESLTEKKVSAFDLVAVQMVDRPIMHILVFFLVIAAVYFCRNSIVQIIKIENKRTLIYGLYLVIGILFITTAQIKPGSDAAEVYEVAQEVLSGDSTAYSEVTGYMYRYPFQNGVVLLNIILIKIFGDGAPMCYQFLNLIFQILFVVYAGKVVDAIWNNKSTSALTKLLISCFPVFFLFVFHNYGDGISLSLIMMAIYFLLCFLDNKKIKYAFWGVVLASLSCILKSNSRVIIIAIAICIVLSCLKERKYGNLLLVVILIVARIAAFGITDATMEAITKVETPKGMPMINWVCMGMINDGTFNGTSVGFFEDSGYDYDKSVEISKEFLKKRLRNMCKYPVEATRWFGRKMAIGNAEPTYDVFGICSREKYGHWNMFYGALFKGKIRSFLARYLNLFQSLVYALALTALISMKEVDSKKMFFALCFLGGFLFHLVWEISPHYMLRYFIFLFPYAAEGIKVLRESILLRKYNIFLQLSTFVLIGLVIYFFKDVRIVNLLFFAN